MFLDYGLNEHGEMIHIDDVGRGRVLLACPYCGRGLIARKGQKLAHHFAHDGETCREVATRDAVQLPVYDNFGLSLSGRNWERLQKIHKGGSVYPGDQDFFTRLGLIAFNGFAGGRYSRGEWELTDKGKIPFGETTLQKFAHIQRELIEEQHLALEGVLERATTAANKQMYLADLQLYRAQFRRVLACSLYFLEIKHKEGKLYKIGVTSRGIEERTAELVRDLGQHYQGVKIRVLRLLKNQGSLEHYFKHRYKGQAVELGTFTEYFNFPERRNILSDLTRLGDRDLTSFESDVIDDRLPEAAAAVRSGLLQLQRIERIKEGMAAAAAEGVHIGRPAGTDESTADFLAKYPGVVKAIGEGYSLRKAAEAAGVSVNTVRKVKKLIKEGE